MKTTKRWLALPLIVSGLVLLPASAAWAAPPEPDRGELRGAVQPGGGNPRRVPERVPSGRARA